MRDEKIRMQKKITRYLVSRLTSENKGVIGYDDYHKRSKRAPSGIHIWDFEAGISE